MNNISNYEAHKRNEDFDRIADERAMARERQTYVIQSLSEDGYWSNDLGWVEDLGSATRFTGSESLQLRLPLSAGNDAQWVIASQVKHCPCCGSDEVEARVEWRANSLEPHDASNEALLREWFCGMCDTPFWIPTTS